ncbi:MAG: hypothetical protein KDD66_17470, partial [Bdellovibrionales bacterium]|nr:hypothetical protein [Bdellovibrionales bacterium]
MMTFRDKRGFSSRLRASVPKLAAVGAGALFFLSSSVASADELKILDLDGKTRSAVILQEGGSATVTVEVTKVGSTLAGIPVSLVNGTNGQLVQTSMTDQAGIAIFKNVPNGTFNLSVKDSMLKVSDVKINLNGSQQTSSDSEAQKREDARVMYIAGAGAVAGGIGIAIGAGNSGSGSGSSTASLSGEGFGASGAGGSGPGGTGAGSFDSPAGEGGTAAALNDTPPNPGSPNMGGGTPNTLGPVNNNSGDPSQGGTGGVGGGGDTTPNPGSILQPPPT